MIERNEITWVTDDQLRVTAVSRRLRELLGPALATATDLPVTRLFASEDPFQIVAVAHEWAAEGELVDFELPWHDGIYRLHVQPMHSVSGSIVGVIGSACEIEQHAAQEGLAHHLEALNTAETLSGMGSWCTDMRTGKTVWSKGLCSLLALDAQPAHGTIRDFDHPEDCETVAALIAEAGRKATGYRCDHRIVRADGQIRYVQEQAHVQLDHSGDAIAINASMLDITERKIAESRLKYLAHYDSVSNLPNRALLEERLAASIARAERSERLCALLFLDIDGFKEVNDELGHAAGDELLAAVGSRLQRHVRANDTVARIGGDEFVIVLDDLASNHDAHEGARKVLEVFKDQFSIGGVRRNISASIGISIFPFTALTPAELIGAADAAMYVVKKSGGAGFEAARPKTPDRDSRKVHAACARKETAAKFGDIAECAISSAAKHRSERVESGLASG